MAYDLDDLELDSTLFAEGDDDAETEGDDVVEGDEGEEEEVTGEPDTEE